MVLPMPAGPCSTTVGGLWPSPSRPSRRLKVWVSDRRARSGSGSSAGPTATCSRAALSGAMGSLLKRSLIFTERASLSFTLACCRSTCSRYFFLYSWGQGRAGQRRGEQGVEEEAGCVSRLSGACCPLRRAQTSVSPVAPQSPSHPRSSLGPAVRNLRVTSRTLVLQTQGSRPGQLGACASSRERPNGHGEQRLGAEAEPWKGGLR